MHLPKAILFAMMFCLPAARAVDDTVTIVDGTSATIGAFASSGTNNFLMITNGGSASLTSIANSGRSNVVIVTGAGSTIANNATLTLASGGSSNALILLDGGSMSRALTTAGTNNLLHIENSTNILTTLTFGGRSNIVQLDNASVQATTCQINSVLGNYLMANSSKWSDNSFDTTQGRTNYFLVSGGSVRASGSWSLAAAGDTLQVTDPGSIWRVTNLVVIGRQSSGISQSQAQIIAGGHADLRSNVDLGSNSSFNRLIVDGVGSDARIVGSLNLGSGGGTSNAVLVTSGGQLHTGSALIGSTGNSITVSGAGSSWDNTNTFNLNGGFAAHLAALGGGAISIASVPGGNNVLTIDASSHITVSNAVSVGTRLSVTGGGLLKSGSVTGGTAIDISGGSTWSVVTNLSLTDIASGSLLLVSEGSTLKGARLSFTSSSSDPALTNLVDITGEGSSLVMASIVADSRGQRIFVENGGRIQSGDFTSARENTTVEVSGAISAIQIAGNLQTTNTFTNNIFRVTSGGVLTNGSASIGAGPDGATTAFMALSSASIDGAGSRWLTGTNLVIGQHASSNNLAISNGGSTVVSNLTIGYFQPTNTVLPVPTTRSGSQNALYIDGVTSRLDASGDIRVGYNSLSNQFTITGGAAVTARNFSSGIIASSKPTMIVRSNVVQIIGPNSTLTVSSNASFSNGSYLVVSNSAAISAGGIATLADHTVIVANSQLRADQAVQTYASEILIENSRIATPTFLLGWLFDTAHAVVTGSRSSVQCDVIHIAKTDAQSRNLNGTAILDVLDSANVTSRWFTIGLNAPTNAPVVNIDGGSLNIGAPDLRGLLEIERGTLTIHRGNVTADSVLIHGSDAVLNIDGGLFAAGDVAVHDGDLRIGSGLTLDQGASVHVAGPVAFAHGSKLQVILGDTSGSSQIVAAGPATLGGQLTVSMAPYQTNAPAVIPILSAASLSGKFENVAAGERISTTEGAGTFLLNVTGTEVTLSDFAAVETRLSAALNAAGSAIVLTFPAAFNAAIQTSTNLTDWISVTNPQSQTVNGQTEATLTIDQGEAQRFYRLVR
jgi:hypothetical protein